MYPTREGRYQACVVECGIDQTGKNNLVTFTARYRLVNEQINGEWFVMPDGEQECEIVGYHYLEKRDGTLNTETIRQLQEAFGWDGRDPFWLVDHRSDDALVQITLREEEYQGKKRLRVAWLDAADAQGGGVRNASNRSAVMNRIGAKLRAVAGGTPAPAPKPTGKPTPPASRAAAPSPAPAAAAMTPAITTLDQAWQWFVESLAPNHDPDGQTSQWFVALRGVFGHDDAKAVKPEEWSRFVSEARKYVLPF